MRNDATVNMSHAPRRYQSEIKQAIDIAWGQYRNVLAVLPTGGGKTFVFSWIASECRGMVIAIAHRAELVSQMSTALARAGVRHRVIGQSALQRTCTQIHMLLFQRSFVDPNARVVVASVDTLIGMDPQTPWFAQVELWIQDEAHHVLEANKWGTACKLFPNARGLGVTATPLRADGKGLGRHADGLFDYMTVGPSMRELIVQGYLTDYRVFAPPSDIDLTNVTITDSGDYSPPKLKQARRQSHITGDVVQHYLRVAAGKRGITFDTDIESATETAAAFRAAGVPAEVVTSKTPDLLREQIKRRFAAGEILELVNVDLFGEGYDLPAIEVVSMARPTQSYGLYVQQFGRALRPLEGKTRAVILDHVGNVERHGLPDARREWTLDRRERRSRNAPNDVIPVRTCLNETCLAVYERTFRSCPYCGHTPPIADRSSPDRVDGDLYELDPAVLARLRGESARIAVAPDYPFGATPEVRGAIDKRHLAKQRSLETLKKTIALWAGWQASLGRDYRESYRRFYFAFGVDVATAQCLPAADADALNGKVQDVLSRHNVVEATL